MLCMYIYIYIYICIKMRAAIRYEARREGRQKTKQIRTQNQIGYFSNHSYKTGLLTCSYPTNVFGVISLRHKGGKRPAPSPCPAWTRPWLPGRLPGCLPACLPACPPARPPARPPACLPVCTSASASATCTLLSSLQRPAALLSNIGPMSHTDLPVHIRDLRSIHEVRI